MKIFLKILLPVLVLFCGESKAQLTRYIVRFADKSNNPYSISQPSAFLSPRALERRTRHGIAINQTDLPVSPGYIDSVRLSGNVTILNSSKWLNQVAIQTSDSAALVRISQFPFVLNTQAIASREIAHGNKFPTEPLSDLPLLPRPQQTEGYYSYGRSGGQINLHRGSFLHELGFRGQGMQMSLMDAGFFRYQTLPTFDSVRTNGQILGTWDFVRNEVSVNEDNSHGMQCFSTIAANMPGIFTGTAPGASFYLFRSEDVNSEYPIEEHFWAAAAERADSLGVDVISTSLGYTTFSDPAFDYTYADMNGHTTMIAKAAATAASKGMLVLVSAGNDGTNAWRYICTPADADSVITVGAVDTLGRVGNFSSYGPSSDGRQKPSLTAVGWNAIVASASSGLPAVSSGTSFSCPNLAGLATCLWQGFPEISNMELQHIMEQSAHKADDPDDRVGYGIPDMKKAFIKCLRRTCIKTPVVARDCQIDLSLRIRVNSKMQITVERKLSGESSYSDIFYGTGNDFFSDKDFTWTDDLTGQPAGNISYRFRMEIMSDTSFYLDSLNYQIISSCEINGDQANFYQEPGSQDEIFVRWSTESPGPSCILIYNTAGQLIKKNDSNHPGGIRTEVIRLAGLPKGIYVIRAQFKNSNLNTKKFLRP